MVTRLAMSNRRSSRFYEFLRNRFNVLTVLRDGDYVHEVSTGIEWRLLQDVDINGSARSLCTYAPDGCGVKLGTPMKVEFYDENDRLGSIFRRGMNPNRRF